MILGAGNARRAEKAGSTPGRIVEDLNWAIANAVFSEGAGCDFEPFGERGAEQGLLREFLKGGSSRRRQVVLQAAEMGERRSSPRRLWRRAPSFISSC